MYPRCLLPHRGNTLTESARMCVYYILCVRASMPKFPNMSDYINGHKMNVIHMDAKHKIPLISIYFRTYAAEHGRWLAVMAGCVSGANKPLICDHSAQ